MPEQVGVVERGGQAAGRVADLLFGLDGAVGVEEQDVDRAAVGAAVVVEMAPTAMSSMPSPSTSPIPATQRRTRRCRRGWRSGRRRVADLLFGFDGAVGVEEQDVDRAPVGAAVVVAVAPTAMSLTPSPSRSPMPRTPAEAVGVVEGGGQAAGGVADLLFGLDGAVGVEEQDVDGAAVGAAVVVA